MNLIRTLMVSLLALASPALAAGPSHDARPALLTALDGHWVAVGDVMGKRVTYDVAVSPTLHGTFTEIHMRDVQVPSRYEARVFIGTGRDGGVIVHWLDSFGAEGSIPHGTGTIKGHVLVFHFPYPGGTFRDTIVLHPRQHTWTLTIEAARPGGRWAHFARYDIRPVTDRHRQRPPTAIPPRAAWPAGSEPRSE